MKNSTFHPLKGSARKYIILFVLLGAVSWSLIQTGFARANNLQGAKIRAGKAQLMGKPAEYNGLAINGQFHFPIDSTLSNATIIVALLGNKELGQYNFSEIKNHQTQQLYPGCNLQMYIANLQYFISASIHDLNDNLILEIKDNKWRIYPNAVSKYNYDAKGFEVFDKTGRIALSIDFRLGNQHSKTTPTLYVQGVIPCKEHVLGFFQTSTFLPDFNYSSPADARQLYDSLPIKPMFRYLGNNWQGDRLPTNP